MGDNFLVLNNFLRALLIITMKANWSLFASDLDRFGVFSNEADDDVFVSPESFASTDASVNITFFF